MLAFLTYCCMLLLVALALLELAVGDSQLARDLRAGARGGAYFFDPATTTGAILISLAISGATTAASYVAGRVLAPKAAPLDRGKLNDLRVTGSDYGGTRLRGFGRFRAGGNIIYASGVREIVTTSHERTGGGGKGGLFSGPTQPVNNYSYYTDLVIAVCEGPVNSVRKIWSDDQIILNLDGSEGQQDFYEAERSVNTLAGGAAVVAATLCSGGQKVTLAGAGQTVSFNRVRAQAAGSRTLKLYYLNNTNTIVTVTVNGSAQSVTLNNSAGAVADKDVTITLAAGANNTIVVSGASAGPLDIDRIQISPAPVAAEDIEITQLVDEFNDYPADRDRPRPYYNYRPVPDSHGTSAGTLLHGNAGIRIYTGTATQLQDSLLVAKLGATKAPAYRDIVYVVLENVQLVDGRVPNYTFEVDEGTVDLDQIITKLYGLRGIAPAQLDVSSLVGATIADWPLPGLLIEERGPLRSTLEYLQIAFQFDLAEVGGKIVATKRGGASVCAIPWQDLRAHEDGDTLPLFDAIVKDAEELSAPRRVDVSYLDPELDYHANTQSASRFTGHTYDVISLHLPMVLRKDQAKQIAEIVLADAHLARRTYEFAVQPKYLWLAPNCVVTLQLRNATHTVRLTNMQAMAGGSYIKMHGVATDASIYTNASMATSVGRTPPTFEPPANALLALLDIPAVRESDADLGYYVAMCGRTTGKWYGGLLYKESTAGVWDLVQQLPAPATMGVVLTPPGAHADVGVIDRLNSLRVGLYSGTLASASETDAYSQPVNLCAAGQELIQFATATPVALPAGSPYSAIYDLTNLMRGRMNTDYLMGRDTDQPIRWTNKVGVSQSGAGTLTKTAATGWNNAGASSTARFSTDEPQVAISFKLRNTTTAFVLGASQNDADQSTGEILHGWYFDGAGNCQVMIAGTLIGSSSPCAANETFEIRWTGRQVRLLHSGTDAYVGTAVPIALLRVDASIYTNGGTINVPRITRPSSADQRAGRVVSFATLQLTNLLSDSNKLVRQTNIAGATEAYALGKEVIAEEAAGEASVTWKMPDLSSDITCGLTARSAAGVAQSNIRYGLRASGGYVWVVENGTVVGAVKNYLGGEELKIALEEAGTVVRYYVAGDLVYESTLAPSAAAPYRFDVWLTSSSPGAQVGPFVLKRSGHYAGEMFVLLDSAVRWRREESAELGGLRRFKGANIGQDIDNATIISHVLTGATVRNPAPSSPRGQRNVPGDLLITWNRRGIDNAGLRDGAGVGIGQEQEIYGLEFLQGVEVKGRLRVPAGAPQQVIWEYTNGGLYSTYPDGGLIETADNVFYVIEAYTKNSFGVGSTIEFTLGAPAPTKFGVTTAIPYYNLLTGQSSPLSTFPFYFNLVSGKIRAENDAATEQTYSAGDRFALVIRGDGIVEYYKNKAAGSAPFFRSTVLADPGTQFMGYARADWSTTPGVGTDGILKAVTLTTPAPFAVYPAARQTADFGAVQSSLRVRLWQESTVAGRGFETEITL